MFKKKSYILSKVRKMGIHPTNRLASTAPAETEAIINNTNVLVFCSNNYLSLANHELVKEAVIKGVHKYGVGSGGSRLASGNTDVQEELEKKVANYKGAEACILFTTGYVTNVGIIPAVLKELPLSSASVLKGFFMRLFRMSKDSDAVVISDELNHASIVDGCRLANAKREIYKHRDVNQLERILIKYRRYEKKLIVTDGVFSMDGDVAPMPKILELSKKYNATVLIDDAHATGVMGVSGKGTLEHFNLQNKYDNVLVMGTFTKALGAIGGFVVGPKDVIDYLRISARPYIFSAPIPPAIVCGIMKALEVLEDESERLTRLWDNTAYMRGELLRRGFNLLESETPIVPIFVGPEVKALKVSQALFKKGIFVTAVHWPATAVNSARLRLTLMSDHSKEHMDRAIDALVEVRKEYDF